MNPYRIALFDTSNLLADSQMAAIPLVVAGASNPVGWVVGGGLALGAILFAAGNKKGGSGEWRQHEKEYPGRKQAEEGARHEKGSTGTIHHPEGDHHGHFHGKDRQGNKIPGTHHKY
jgi:hypothetical protein